MWTILGGSTGGIHGVAYMRSLCVWVMEPNNFDFSVPTWTLAVELV